MTLSNTTTHEVPTRRDVVKGGSAVIGGGLLAGCASNSDQTQTATEGETDSRTPTTTETDTSYDVEVKPYGPVTFEDIPETYVTMGSGAWTDIAFAFGSEPAAMSMTYYPFQYYEALPDVSFDADSVTDLGTVSALDVEQFFEIDADVHIIDKILLSFYADWDTNDFEQVESNVGPFAGSYIRGKWNGEALDVSFSFPYYTVSEATTLVGEIFQRHNQATAWTEQLDSFTTEIAERAPQGSPEIGLLYQDSDPSTGEFYLGSPTTVGVGTYPYEVLDASNAFAEFDFEETNQTDYEGLLELDPEYLCVDSAIGGLSTQEFEAQFVEPIREHPVGQELRAVQNDNVIRGCGRHQGPIIAHFETEAMAKQLYPEEFGEFDAEQFLESPGDDELFDRQRLSAIINGEFEA